MDLMLQVRGAGVMRAGLGEWWARFRVTDLRGYL